MSNKPFDLFAAHLQILLLFHSFYFIPHFIASTFAMTISIKNTNKSTIVMVSVNDVFILYILYFYPLTTKQNLMKFIQASKSNRN